MSDVLHEDKPGSLIFWCPGCGMAHGVNVGSSPAPRWRWNEDRERPTFSPEVSVRYIRGRRMRIVTCRVTVVDGLLMFASDCSHALAGQSVAMTPFLWGK